MYARTHSHTQAILPPPPHPETITDTRPTTSTNSKTRSPHLPSEKGRREKAHDHLCVCDDCRPPSAGRLLCQRSALESVGGRKCLLNDGRTRALEVRGHQPVHCSTVRCVDPTWRGAVVTPTDSGTFSPIPSFGQPREKIGRCALVPFRKD